MWLWDGVVTCWEGGKVCGCEMVLLPAGREERYVAVRWGCYLLGGGKVCGCEMVLLPAGRGKGMWLWDGVVTCWEGKECGCGMGLLPAGRGERYVAVRWCCYLLGGERVWLWDGVARCACLGFFPQCLSNNSPAWMGKVCCWLMLFVIRSLLHVSEICRLLTAGKGMFLSDDVGDSWLIAQRPRHMSPAYSGERNVSVR